MIGVEEWRRVAVAPDYEVSNLGRVRSWKRHHGDVGPRILTPINGSSGYVQVALWVDGRQTSVRVHRLVLAAFVGPLPDGNVTRHLDGDPSNNRLESLRYGTPSENNYDAVRHGTHGMARKTECVHGHAFTPENTLMVRRGRPYRACRACIRAKNLRMAARRRVGATS